MRSAILSVALCCGLALVVPGMLPRAVQASGEAVVDGPPVRKEVTVFLRGDAGGVAFGDRIPAIERMPSRSGRIAAIGSQWIRLDGSDGKTYWIPPSTVLAIVEDKK